LISLAAGVIIIAGMRAASAIVVPFLLALFFAVISGPLLAWIQHRGVPKWLALLLVVALLSAGILMMAGVIGSSVSSFSQNLPSYQLSLQEKMDSVSGLLGKWGVDVPEDALLKQLNPGVAMRLVSNVFMALRGVLSNAFLILLTVIFIFLESSGFAAKLRAAAKDPDASLAQFDMLVEKMQRYVAIKTVTSLATGLLIACWLLFLQVDYALLWGLLAFLLNYVPTIGSIFAAIPALLIALIQLGTGQAWLVLAGYLVVNIGISNVIEPRFMGQGLGLSTLIVFLSLIFWGWVLGPVGMLLGVPLTMAIKIGFESSEATRPIAILLSNGVPGSALVDPGGDESEPGRDAGQGA